MRQKFSSAGGVPADEKSSFRVPGREGMSNWTHTELGLSYSRDAAVNGNVRGATGPSEGFRRQRPRTLRVGGGEAEDEVLALREGRVAPLVNREDLARDTPFCRKAGGNAFQSWTKSVLIQPTLNLAFLC